MSGFVNNRRGSCNGLFSFTVVLFFQQCKCPPSLITMVQGVIFFRELEFMTSLSVYVKMRMDL